MKVAKLGIAVVPEIVEIAVPSSSPFSRDLWPFDHNARCRRVRVCRLIETRLSLRDSFARHIRGHRVHSQVESPIEVL